MSPPLRSAQLPPLRASSQSRPTRLPVCWPRGGGPPLTDPGVADNPTRLGFFSKYVVQACRDHEVRYSITVRQTPVITRAIEQITEDTWTSIDYTANGEAWVGETTYGDQHRLVVRRTKLSDPRPALFPTYRYHAFITDRDGDAVTLDADHRRHAVVELAIRDLKEGSGLEHCPSGEFNANAAWACSASIAHNLVRWVAALGLEITGPLVAKTIRRKFIALPGRITDSGRRRHLHLPTQWPWATSGASASSGSSNYRPNNLGFEAACGTPGDFQREQVTNFAESVTRHVRVSDNHRKCWGRCSDHGNFDQFDALHHRRGGSGLGSRRAVVRSECSGEIVRRVRRCRQLEAVLSDPDDP